jgi:endonuclease/exonuclease/phosphatase (EEP) superfamily protein YafD
LLQVSLEVGGSELVFMATHIDYRPDNSERLMNVGEISEAKNHFGAHPVILCGDFNDTPDGAVHAKMKELFDDAWEIIGAGSGFTFSADKPRKRIDYIWLSKDKSIVPLRLWVPVADASDHLPLVGEFRFR